MQHDMQLRPKDGAHRMGIGLSTFWQWARTDPTFPKLTRIGRTTSVSARALDEYIASKTGAAK